MGQTIDLAGQRFGRLVAIEQAKPPEGATQHQAYWRCRCDCGAERVVTSANLRRGLTRSCGCLRGQLNDQRGFEPGARFGRLVVVSEAPRPEGTTRKDRWWECRCDCGNTTRAKTHELKKGYKQSCGCIRREKAVERARRIAEARAEQGDGEHKSLWRKDWDYERGEDGKLKVGVLTGVALNMQTCKTCGVEFDMYAGTDWAWQIYDGVRYKKFCSYGCMRKHKKGRTKK